MSQRPRKGLDGVWAAQVIVAAINNRVNCFIFSNSVSEPGTSVIMESMRTLLMLLLGGTAAMGQFVIPPSRIPESLRRFEPVAGEKELRCDVVPMRPTLT